MEMRMTNPSLKLYTNGEQGIEFHERCKHVGLHDCYPEHVNGSDKLK